jgi:3'-5' exoribonuclease
MRKFSEMNIGDDVIFNALVESLQKRFTPNKKAYYSLSLTDGETIIDARVWDEGLVEKNEVCAGEVYAFEAHINEYAGKMQYVVRSIQKVMDDVDVSQFYRTAPLSKEYLKNSIKEYIQKIDNSVLRQVVIELIANVKDEFFEYPAAMSMHHNYQYGLMHHTLSMLKIADTCIELYPNINKSLLYSGVLIHDVGKTKELSKVHSPVYTQEGNLLGHIVIGLQMLAVVANKLQVEETEEVKMLEHMLASHHGELEWGSPKEPAILEAYALHYIDLMDSKLAALNPEVAKTQKGTSTGPIGSINRKSLYVPDIN